MYKLETVFDKQERIKKGFANDISGHFSKFEKSDISYAFSEDGNKITFTKTGAELKTLIASKKSMYDSKMAVLEVQKTELKKKLVESGVNFDTTEYGDRAVYPIQPKISNEESYNAIGVESTEPDDETREAIYRYNDLQYECREIKRDISTINILESNLNDKQKYQMTVNQLAVFEKSILDTDEYYFEKGERDEFEKGRSGKYTDNAQNRKLKRVGQEYGSKKKEDDKGGDKEGKPEEQEKKQSTPEELDKLARTLDEETLKRTAAKSSVEAHRKAAHQELLRRQKDEASDPEESKTMDNHADEMQEQQEGGDEPELSEEEQELQDRADEFDLSVEELQEIEEAAGATLESIEDYDAVGGDGKMYMFDDGSEWNVYDSEDEAREAAKTSLEGLYDDIGIEGWSSDWVESKGFSYISDTDKRLLAGDLSESDRDMIEEELRDSGDYEDEDGEFDQDQFDADVEAEISEKYDEYKEGLENDPKDLLVNQIGIYSEEDYNNANFVQVDTDALFEASIDEDGIAHTLASYDHEEVEAGGKLMYRHN